MKKAFPVLCLILSLVVNSSFSQSVQENLIGKWQLVRSGGGRTGNGVPIRKKGILEFTTHGKLNIYGKDSLESSYPYRLVKSAPKYGKKDSTNYLEVNGTSGRTLGIFVADHLLSLSGTENDNQISTFRKVSLAYTPQEMIVGRWLPFRKSGGIAGGLHAVAPDEVIEFTSNCEFIMYKSDTLKFKNSYQVVKSNSIRGDDVDMVFIDNRWGKMSFRATIDRLFLFEEYYDGFTTEYVRAHAVQK